MGKKSGPEERHIILSGGSRGLGLGICRSLLQDGYRVSTFSRQQTEEVLALGEESEGGRFYFATADICSSDNLSTFVRDAISANGKLYGVINNAAIAQQGILGTLPEIEISRMLSVNLEGAIRLTRLCLKSLMIRKSGGRIINISSIVGIRGYNGLAVYSATKAALDGMTRGLSREVGRRKITVNSVAPGYMRTAMSAGLEEAELQQIIRRTPLGRLAEITDIVPIIQFLLSDDAAFLTGQTIVVDGGISS